MNTVSKLAVRSGFAIALAATVSTSAFADWRNPDETRSVGQSHETRDRDYRDHERVTLEGRISNIVRERDGYRVQIDRNPQWFWVAAREVRGDFRIGTDIRLGGEWRRGQVFVDVIEYPVQRVYVRGTVQSVDYRRGLIYVRDEVRRQLLTIDANRLDRTSRRFDVDEVRRGDAIEVWGDWAGHGVLNAFRIEGRNTRRY